jgi:hypothetical protein
MDTKAQPPPPARHPMFADLGDLPEDTRIGIMGQAAQDGKRIAFVVEDDAKADRYIEKLLARYRVRVLLRGLGPIRNSVTVSIGPAV